MLAVPADSRGKDSAMVMATTEYARRRARAAALRRRLQELAAIAWYEEELTSRLHELRVARTRLEREMAATEQKLARTRARLGTAETAVLEGLDAAVEAKARANRERRRTAEERRRRKAAETKIVTLLARRSIEAAAD
jgi:hypothetical protein